MAKKQLPEKVFKPEPVKAKKFKEVPTPTTEVNVKIIDKIEGEGYHRQNIAIDPTEKFNVKLDTWTKPVASPAEFLTSKGHQQVHEGQRIYATFEEVHQLLKEYREL